MKEAVRTLVILFADIGDSTALYQRIGDVEAHRQVADSLGRMRGCIEAAGGTLLRTVGDAALASFERADDAIQAACEIQREHRGSALSVRVGFHVGEVIPDGGDVYGHAVNIAARIASFARTDEITATGQCIAALSERNRLLASPLDRIRVKGVSEPLEVWRVDWQPSDGQQTAIAAGWREAEPVASSASIELRSGTRRFQLGAGAGPCLIGRSLDCDIVIDSDHASRRHALIEFAHGQCLVTDTSTNGTWLCAARTRPVLVRRDTVVLDGRGELGLGVRPGEPGAMPLAYRTLGERQRPSGPDQDPADSTSQVLQRG